MSIMPEPKLRRSCASCAVAKVKCSKTQPCEKCVAKGLVCVYRPSRQNGRPSKQNQRPPLPPSPKNPQIPFTPPTSAPPPDMPFDQTAYLHTTPQQQQQQLQSFDELLRGFDCAEFLTEWALSADNQHNKMCPQSPTATSPSSRHNSTFDNGPDDFPDLFSSPSSVVDYQEFGDPFSALSRDTSASNLSSVASSAAGTTTPSTAPSEVSSLGNPTMHPSAYCHVAAQAHDSTIAGGGCYALAQATLGSLQSDFGGAGSRRSSSKPGSRDSSMSAPPLSSVLRNNRAAIENVLRLLKCPCARDAHMALMHASIASKILICYQSAAGIRLSSPAPHCKLADAYTPFASAMPMEPQQQPATVSLAPMPGGGDAMDTGPDHVDAAAIASEPITIGSFALDPDEHTHLRQMLLLTELSKTAPLIDALTAMNANTTSEDEATAGYLYAILGSWLRLELSRTADELKRGSAIQTD